MSVASSQLTLEGIERFLIIEFLLINAEPVEHRWWHDQLDDDSPNERECTKRNAEDLFILIKWNCLEGTSSEVYKNDLDDKDQEQDDNESVVVEEISKDIVLLVLEFTGIDHVKDLSHDECLEDNGVDFTFVCWLTTCDISPFNWVLSLCICNPFIIVWDVKWV